ncbi:MAG TPA: PASTA domain-containing protein, partial [Acetivibrio sp.]|nr:PASTA domain-containing protein [Acetivibrio sp.]
VPDIRDKSISDAKKLLNQMGLKCRIEGEGYDDSTVIKDQTPKPGALLAKDSVVIVYTNKQEEEIMVKVPDVTNKTIDEATQSLNAAGLNIKVVGNGTAVRQKVEPGTEVRQGEVIEVEFLFLDVH